VKIGDLNVGDEFEFVDTPAIRHKVTAIGDRRSLVVRITNYNDEPLTHTPEEFSALKSAEVYVLPRPVSYRLLSGFVMQLDGGTTPTRTIHNEHWSRARALADRGTLPDIAVSYLLMAMSDGTWQLERV